MGLKGKKGLSEGRVLRRVLRRGVSRRIFLSKRPVGEWNRPLGVCTLFPGESRANSERIEFPSSEDTPGKFRASSEQASQTPKPLIRGPQMGGQIRRG